MSPGKHRGRHRVLTRDKLEMILDGIGRLGMSNAAASERAGVRESVFYDEMTRGRKCIEEKRWDLSRELVERIPLALAQFQAHHLENVIECSGAKKYSPRWKVSMALLRGKFPQDFATTRQEVRHSGEVKHSVVAEIRGFFAQVFGRGAVGVGPIVELGTPRSAKGLPARRKPGQDSGVREAVGEVDVGGNRSGDLRGGDGEDDPDSVCAVDDADEGDAECLRDDS